MRKEHSVWGKKDMLHFFTSGSSASYTLQYFFREKTSFKATWFQLRRKWHWNSPLQWQQQHQQHFFRKSKHGEKFRDAVIACLTVDHVAYGPGARLMTVGKLRKLLKVPNFVDKFKNRAFRINAFKDYDGLWKEFPSGKVIEFWHYFPDFVPAWGHHGDTLIWLSRWNSLRVVRDTQDDHNALCYREKLGGKPDSLTA